MLARVRARSLILLIIPHGTEVLVREKRTEKEKKNTTYLDRVQPDCHGTAQAHTHIYVRTTCGTTTPRLFTFERDKSLTEASSLERKQSDTNGKREKRRVEQRSYLYNKKRKQIQTDPVHLVFPSFFVCESVREERECVCAHLQRHRPRPLHPPLYFSPTLSVASLCFVFPPSRSSAVRSCVCALFPPLRRFTELVVPLALTFSFFPPSPALLPLDPILDPHAISLLACLRFCVFRSPTHVCLYWACSVSCFALPRSSTTPISPLSASADVVPPFSRPLAPYPKAAPSPHRSRRVCLAFWPPSLSSHSRPIKRCSSPSSSAFLPTSLNGQQQRVIESPTHPPSPFTPPPLLCLRATLAWAHNSASCVLRPACPLFFLVEASPF